MHWYAVTFSPSIYVEFLFFIFKVSFGFTKHHLFKNPLCHTAWTKMLSSSQRGVPLGTALFHTWEACHLSAPGCQVTVESVRLNYILLWATRDVASEWHWFNHWLALGVNADPVKSPPEFIIIQPYFTRSRFCIRARGAEEGVVPAFEGSHVLLECSQVSHRGSEILQQVLSVPDNGVKTIKSPLTSPEYLSVHRAF